VAAKRHADRRSFAWPVDARARKLHTTAAYMSMIYTLRAHIQLIRDRLLRSMAVGGGTGDSHAP